VRDSEADRERTRLGHLATARDPNTFAALERVGVETGWHCLEVGAGAGTVTAWLAERVGPTGRVMSTDIDTRFHGPVGPNVILRQHDITADPLPSAHFDLIHARAVLQHLPEGEAVIDRFSAALKPGGWLVVEDGNFLGFAEQTLPEPYATIHGIICAGTTTQWRDPNFALHLLAMLRDRGYTDLDAAGDSWAMRPGEPAGEWWFLAVEWAGERLVEAGLIDQATLAAAVAQIRSPGFVMLSPMSLAVTGRKDLP
jgi:SAM-dependent methyltransferase